MDHCSEVTSLTARDIIGKSKRPGNTRSRVRSSSPVPETGGLVPRLNIDYLDASRILTTIAHQNAFSDETTNGAHVSRVEEIPLCESIGRISARTYRSQFATPPADTSAMDGFAVSSAATCAASPETPVCFEISGRMLAGAHERIRLACTPKAAVWPCVEIATGAQFPATDHPTDIEHPENSFDAVVPIENAIRPAHRLSGPRYIFVDRPVHPHQHKRFAGCDIPNGCMLLPLNSIIQPQHVIALASLGIFKVLVQKRLRVGVWSTGDEVVGMDEIDQENMAASPERSRVFDANGPYLMSSLIKLGFDAYFLGSVKDHGNAFMECLKGTLAVGEYDLLLSSGAVSVGIMDFIRPALEKASAVIHFHGVRIRPGHPILFATFQQGTASLIDLEPGINGVEPFNNTDKQGSHVNTSFFGLPGNPIAAAVGFRFFVVPYLRALQGLPSEQPIQVTVAANSGSSILEKLDMQFKAPKDKDTFWHGSLQESHTGIEFVLSNDQSPGKVKPFHSSTGWVHIPKGYNADEHGNQLAYYPALPT